MSKKASTGLAVGIYMLAAMAQAAPPKDPPNKCAPDAVLAGDVCIDTYEASVWRIPAFNLAGKSNEGLIKKVRKGKADLDDLIAGDATKLGDAIQQGASGDDYAPCNDNGTNCVNDIYAVSLPGVTPSAHATWFQMVEACTNSGKRLPSNAEWQAAATGSPDPGADNGTTDCNTGSGAVVVPTGSRSGCVSVSGAFDMVGNLQERVADWVPASTACNGWGAFSDDYMCLSGASTTATAPGALLRGSGYIGGTVAGPLSVDGTYGASASLFYFGFRCAR